MIRSVKIAIGLVGIFCLMAMSITSHAQQDPMYTQYMFNTLAVNPGYAGSRDVLNATGLLRTQWVGIDGAPNTQTFFLHSPLWDKSLGAGLSFVKDQIGPINQTMIFGDVSYTMPLTARGDLSFGVKFGINMLQGNFTQLETTETGDEIFGSDVSNPVLPNFGFGLYYHERMWYVGLSTPKLLQNSFEGDLEYSKVSEKRHYFLIAGYVLELNESVKFKPSILTKVTAGAPVSMDATAMFLFKDKLWLGGGWRFGDSFSGILELQLNDQMRFGYSYDYTTSALARYNSGSHEVMLSYDFMYNRDKIMSPRYF